MKAMGIDGEDFTISGLQAHVTVIHGNKLTSEQLKGLNGKLLHMFLK